MGASSNVAAGHSHSTCKLPQAGPVSSSALGLAEMGHLLVCHAGGRAGEHVGKCRAQAAGLGGCWGVGVVLMVEGRGTVVVVRGGGRVARGGHEGRYAACATRIAPGGTPRKKVLAEAGPPAPSKAQVRGATPFPVGAGAQA